MQNLYDLLGVRPDDDAESLRKAFRKAAKASHPDHHGGDPEAAARFRRITQAYDILRDAAKRAAYDRRLQVYLDAQRRPLRTKLRRTLFRLKRRVVRDAIIGVGVAVMLAGGYGLFVYVPKMTVHGADAVKARTSGGAAAVRPEGRAGVDTPGSPAGAAAHMPILIPVVFDDAAPVTNGRGVLEMAKGDPAPDSAGQAIEVAKGSTGSDIPADQPATTPGAGSPGKNPPGEPIDQRPASAVDVPLSAPEKTGAAQRLPSSGSADGKAPEPAEATAGDAKPAGETRGSLRPPAAAKHRPAEQASLEGRGDRPAGDHPERPPLFGVGF